MALGGWWIWHLRGGVTAPVAQEPVSVLIANFENRANEPLFDGLIEQALGVGIEGASFVSTIPVERRCESSQQINPNAVARRQQRAPGGEARGIKRIVSGSITADGSQL